MPTADDAETPLPAVTPAPEVDPTAPQARAFWWLLPLAAVLAALAVWGIARARRTPADTVRAEFRALYKKMCRCGLGEGVSSDQEEFKQFLWEHTKTAAPQDVETLLALVQTAQFAPGPVSARNRATGTRLVPHTAQKFTQVIAGKYVIFSRGEK